MSLTFVIPDEPVAKARPRVTFKNGKAHAYTPKKTSDAEWRIEQHVRGALTKRRGSALPLLGGLGLTVIVYVKPPSSLAKKLFGQPRTLPTKRPDLDNFWKLVVDALSRAGVWKDDAQIVDTRVAKHYTWTNEPRWEISVDEYL